MITIDEAREIIRSQVFETVSVVKKISEICKSDILAEDIYTPVDLPLFSNSMMDGYVISEIKDHYKVVGEIKAGDNHKVVIKSGEAYRIFTGAPTPVNAYAVVMQEKVERKENIVSFSDEITKGKNIRIQGDEVEKGNKVLPKETLLTPGVIGFLATMGIQSCRIFNKPKISILSTGDECKPANTELKYGQIYESNSIMLLKALEENGFEVNSQTHASDTYDHTKSQINQLLKSSDVLIVTGGISVGDHDYVGRCIKDLGIKELIYKIKQKPGKPFYCGRLENKLVLALPGNPASSLTCMYQYGLPAIKRMAGTSKETIFPTEIQMTLNHKHVKKGDRPEFVRSHYHPSGNKVDILIKQRSSMLHSYALANCLVFLQEGIYDLDSGTKVSGYLF